ncbi:MAG: tRNA (adenosine(37)-N6)-threonylcarbamoyltransferase complex ATPase subunit type 1 TsaE [Bacteroidetes bacterium]|nr:tRNA (adenosine(37)-N6)-threonylcarbamoyltransferase complex ATPase subunit type 1 TsaE [Bacteroidota bacterium]
MEFILEHIGQLPVVAKKFLKENFQKKIFAFHGELGAGKTTFIKAVCEQLGVKDVMSSPSFSIVNEYRDKKNIPVYHIDLYRIKSIDEAMNAGVEEYLYSGNYCFIEWPEKAEEILPSETVHVYMTSDGGVRKLTVGSKE